MHLIGKNILLISPEPWDHINVSKHHYARYLVRRGNQVVFANPANDQWLLKDAAISGLKELYYPKFIKGLRLFPSFISGRLIRRKFEQIQEYCQIKFDIVWSFDNSVFFDFSRLPTYNISHIVDLNQDFETEKAASTADICFYTTELIGERLKKYNPRSFFINHGFNQKEVTSSVSLPGDQPIKVLYAGNLNMPYLDWKCISEAVVIIDVADFIFLGPVDDTVDNNETWSFYHQVKQNPRTHFVGKIPSDQLPNYYAVADVLIVAYQERYHKDQANPHKMMEYLGTGKPIVATYTAMFGEYERGVIEMCRRNSEFASELKSCVENLSKYNTSELIQGRKSIALDNGYDRQITRIEEYIRQNG